MKVFLNILIIFFVMTLGLNAQIPNGGFENWTTEGGIEIPSAPWITNNLQNKPFNVTFNPVTKSTDHYPINEGSYAIRLENNISFVSEPGEPLPYWACSYGYATTAFHPGYSGPVFPITGHPDSLNGYYKFLPQNSDTMLISVALYYQGEIVSSAILYDSRTTDEWTFFTMPIPAYSVADSAQIGFSAFYTGPGPVYPQGPYGNSILYIDNLSFNNPRTTRVNELQGVTPLSFKLDQNYPNPFNPSTRIEFILPFSEYTTLKIYNILGAEVATLVSDKLEAGRHTYQFDGAKLASGVYYFQVTAGEFRDIRKMILLR